MATLFLVHLRTATNPLQLAVVPAVSDVLPALHALALDDGLGQVTDPASPWFDGDTAALDEAGQVASWFGAGPDVADSLRNGSAVPWAWEGPETGVGVSQVLATAPKTLLSPALAVA